MAKKPAEGIELDVKPTSQVDLERRLGEDPPVRLFETVGPGESTLTADDESEGGEGTYIGTDPIYQNHANDTDKPLQAEEGPDKLAEDAYFDSLEGKTEAGDQLKTLYGDVTPGDGPTNEATEQAGGESTDSTNKDADEAADSTNPSSSTQS